MRTCAAILLFAFGSTATSSGLQTSAQNAPTRPGLSAIAGQLRNIDGTPAAGVRVGVLDVNSTGTDGGGAVARLAGLAETDSAGRYRIEGVAPGTYLVIAGFLDAPTYFPGVTTVAEARTLNVAAGSAIDAVDFQLARGGGVRVTGSVQGIPADLPRDLVRVTLQPVVPTRPPVAPLPFETGIDAGGTFEFPRVSPGRYLPRVSILGRLTESPIIVVEDRAISGLALKGLPFLTGRVEVEGGGLLPVRTRTTAASAVSPETSQVGIVARRKEPGDSLNSARTTPVTVHADGFFAFPADPGDHQLFVRSLPVGYYVKSVSYGAVDVLTNSFRVGSGTPAPLRVVLTTARPAGAPPEVRVSGKVTGLPSGTSPSTQLLTFTLLVPGQGELSPVTYRTGEVRAGEDGTFALARVPPGFWTISVLDLETRTSSGKLEVLIGDRDVTGLEVLTRVTPRPAPPATLSGGVTVSGRVIAPKSAASPASFRGAAQLRFLGPGPRMQAPIRPDGSFSFSNVPQGTALLSVDGSIEDLVGRQIVVGDRDVTGLEFTLRELPEMFDLTGRFIVDGSEVIPAELSRLQLRAQRPRTGGPNSMPQGGVIAMQLSPGDYELSVQGLPQNYEVVSISYGDLDLRTASLKVDAPLTKEVVVRIGTFPPRGAFAKVSGRVTNLPAAPYIQNPKIILRRDLKAGGGTLETRVAADGTFAFPGAPPGRYTLTTSGLTADFQRSLEVKDADIADVTVALAGLSVPPSSEALVGMNLFGDIDITLRGVISEVVTQRRSGPPSPAYVRMEIPDAAGELKSWMVMFSLPRPAAGEPAPDTTKLKRGTHVIVVGTPAIDGSNRLFLTPRSGPTTVLGIEIVPD